MKAQLVAFWLWIKALWNRMFGKTAATPAPPADLVTIARRIELLKDASVYWHAQNPNGEQYRDILLEIAQLEKMEKSQAYVLGQTITRLK